MLTSRAAFPYPAHGKAVDRSQSASSMSSLSSYVRSSPDPVMPGRESVWAYPRPAIAQPTRAHVQIVHAGVIVADTRSSARTLETSHPPSYYLPPSDTSPRMLQRAGGGSFCEWKGDATYWDGVIGDRVLPRVGWSYPRPTGPFQCLRDHLALRRALRSLQRRWRTGHAPGRRVLRWLDYLAPSATVQGRPRDHGLVRA